MWCKRHLKLLYMQSSISKSYFDKSLKWHLTKKITFFAKFVHVLHKRQCFIKTLGVFTDGKLNKPTQDSHHLSKLTWPCPASLRFYHYKWSSSNHISPTLKQYFRLNCWRKKKNQFLFPFILPMVVELTSKLPTEALRASCCMLWTTIDVYGLVLRVGVVLQQIPQVLDDDTGQLPPDIPCPWHAWESCMNSQEWATASLHHPNPARTLLPKILPFSGSHHWEDSWYGEAVSPRLLGSLSTPRITLHRGGFPSYLPSFTCGESIKLLYHNV